MPAVPSDAEVAAVRAFNRFYTRKLGVLEHHFLESPFSLTEARVLYELKRRDGVAAKEIAAGLGLDSGYLSRILQGFADQGLITRRPAPDDRRQSLIALTSKGKLAAGKLDRSSQEAIGAMLAALPAGGSARLVEAMATLERLLDAPEAAPAVALRGHRPGDMGWVVQAHGALYAREYGWSLAFEGLVAGIVAQFVRDFDPTRERCWIAERDGRQIGSVFLMRQSHEVAQLRLLLVAPEARGTGLGKRLVDECIVFARSCGYRRITLWTQSILVAARGIYAGAGFVRTATEPHRSFGCDLVGETWELAL